MQTRLPLRFGFAYSVGEGSVRPFVVLAIFVDGVLGRLQESTRDYCNLELGMFAVNDLDYLAGCHDIFLVVWDELKRSAANGGSQNDRVGHIIADL